MPPSTYYVVRFGVPPRPNVDKCVCVPDTWLKWIDESNTIASVAYPEGNPADIEKLARNNRSDPLYWLKYNAYVEFSASSYEKAMEYLRARRQIESFGTISIVPTNESRFSEVLSRPRPTATTSNSGVNYVNNKAYKRPSLASPYARTPIRQIRPQEKMKSPAGAEERLRVLGSQYPVHDDRPSRSLQASLESRSTNVSHETSRSFPMQNVQATQGVLHQRPGSSSDHACCSTKFDAAFRSMQAEIQKLALEVERWVTVTDQNVDKLIEIDAWMEADTRWKRTYASHLSNRSSISEMPQNIRNGTISIENDDDDVDHGNSSATNQVITAEEPWRVLPLEYNRNDSKWTLKYHHPRPTLMELLPCSGVYVDAIKLMHCRTVARDCKALAQMLMVEVFTDRALAVCSLTGSKPPTNNCDIPASPGLDANAKSVIIRYAVKWGRERNWDIPDVQAFRNAMRDKLKICRRRVTRAIEKKKKLISTINLA